MSDPADAFFRPESGCCRILQIRLDSANQSGYLPVSDVANKIAAAPVHD